MKKERLPPGILAQAVERVVEDQSSLGWRLGENGKARIERVITPDQLNDSRIVLGNDEVRQDCRIEPSKLVDRHGERRRATSRVVSNEYSRSVVASDTNEEMRIVNRRTRDCDQQHTKAGQFGVLRRPEHRSEMRVGP